MTKRAERQLLTVAYHEAGHAVMAVALGINLSKVTIIPENDSAGHCKHEKITVGDYADNSPRACKRIEISAMISLAGTLAQRIHNPRSVRHYRAMSDYKQACNAAMTLNGSARQETAWLKWIEIKTEDVLRLRWRAVEALSQELMQRKALNGNEARAVVLEHFHAGVKVVQG